jgi:hypothetical protein
MESEMYEGKWSCMHNNQQGSQLKKKKIHNFEENDYDMLLNLRMEGRKGDVSQLCFVFIDQQYLHNDIVMEK